jgi:hypothetical protein
MHGDLNGVRIELARKHLTDSVLEVKRGLLMDELQQPFDLPRVAGLTQQSEGEGVGTDYVVIKVCDANDLPSFQGEALVRCPSSHPISILPVDVFLYPGTIYI